jgi:hypothetical protein
MSTNQKTYIPDPKVAVRYGVDPRTIARWDATPTLNFPTAIRIRNRKYRDVEALERFERERAAKAAQDGANAKRIGRRQPREAADRAEQDINKRPKSESAKRPRPTSKGAFHF